jgi:hypothetical protein
MREVSAILNDAAHKCGLNRARFNEANLPSDMAQVSVFFLTGDIRSMVSASSLWLKRLREETKGSKYTILASWPGFQCLFPYFDEYWEISPALLKSVFWKTTRLTNEEKPLVSIIRNLHYFFDDVSLADDFYPYYQDRLTSKFYERFINVKRFKPVISSASILGNQFIKSMSVPGKKVFLFPTTHIATWAKERPAYEPISKQFWIALVENILKSGHVPVLVNNSFCYDLSPQFVERCIYVSTLDLNAIMAAMRASDAVIDIMNGTSRLALMARCPYVGVDEWVRRDGSKEFELDYFCAGNIPREYIFSFSTILKGDSVQSWQTIFLPLIAKLESIFKDANRDNWPTTSESEEIISHKGLGVLKSKRMGVRFVRIPEF